MFMKSLILAPALLACAFGQGTTMSTALMLRNFTFPPVGLASSETAQVNIVNVASVANAAIAKPVCAGTITFTNASGAAVADPVSFTTTGSQVFSTQLSFSKLASAGVRAEFVASILQNLAVPPSGFCSMAFSLETFDTSTGATHIVFGNSSAVGQIPLPPGVR